MMKLRYQILLITALIWIFLSLGLISLLSFSLTPLSLSIVIIFAVIMYFIFYSALYWIFIEKIETINHSLKNPFKKNELDNIRNTLKILLQKLQATEENLANHLEEQDRSYNSFTKEHLATLAHYDSLTSLPNQVFFNEMLNKSLNHAFRHQKKFALLILDFDRFKNINDALGHKASDQIIKEIANRLTTILRSGDIVARLGGEEFIILLNDIQNPNIAASIAEKLLRTCSLPIKIQEREVAVTASIGICIFPDDGISLEDLQKNADLALYKAKNAGGNNYQYYAHAMTLEANQHIQLDKALHQALNNHEFVLHYQPILNLTTGTITSVEALIRWIHPEIGIINPGHFIAHAEEFSLINPMGEWVLREACRANKSWQDQGYRPIIMTVNLSLKQFKQENIVSIIESILHETGLDPNYLAFEITETTVMEDIAEAQEKLHAIKNLGIKICIDDFGTGYTSISHLKKFPVDILKIDQSFIKELPANHNDLAITSAIIALGHNLGLQVIAEGVETAEQMYYLADHGCDFAQGYFFSRPLPEQKLVLHLMKSKKTHKPKFG